MMKEKEFACDSCRYNVGHDGNGFDYRLPCDQQNCWWVLIDRRDEESSDEEES